MNKRQGSRHVRKSPLRTGEHVTASKRSGGKPHNQTSRKFQPAKNRRVPTLSCEEPDSESDPEENSEDKEEVDIDKSPPTELDAQNAFRSDTPTEDYILFFGLSKVGFDEKRQRRVSRHLSIRRFNAFYRVPPVTVRAIFNDLKADYPSATLHYLLLALNWLKSYSTEPVFSGRWKHCDEHIRKMTKEYARMMQSLMETKITFDGFDPKEIYWISVDTVSFQTQEF